MKICFKCSIEKELGSFYVHKKMKDGHLNKCIDCTKKDVKNRSNELSKDSDWMEKERCRGREKYHRLNYKEKQKELNKNKPWKSNSKYKGLRRKFKHIPKGFELHHWNYNDDCLEDVILMNISDHRRLHNLLELDVEKRIFKVKSDGKYLFSKLDHVFFIIQSGFNCNPYINIKT